MPHKVKQLFTFALLWAAMLYAPLSAQVVRNYPLPSGPGYEFKLHGTPAPGYSFLGSYRFGAAANFPSSILVYDEEGAPMFFKDHPLNQGTIADLRLYDNGLMSYFFFNELTLVGQYYIMDSTFTIIDSVVCANGLKTDGHEMLIQPNGHFLLICLEERIMDLSGLTTDDGFPGVANGTVIAPVIQELDANKNLVFEWHGINYYDLTDIDTYFFLEPDFLDFGHPNALAIDFDDNILMSLRFFNEVTKISRADSSIIWRLGGAQNDFTFINDTQPFSAQHHCVVLPNGNLTLFDNGEIANPPLARGVEYRLDPLNKTATKVWEYTNTPGLISYALGSLIRLDNGNNLIAWGAGFMPGFSNDVEEVDANGNTVTEFDWPQDYFVYRAYKSMPDWDIEALRPTITCDTAGGIATLSAPLGYPVYLWNTGDTTATITITNPGEYYVMVNSLDGRGYFGSRLKTVVNVANPCNDSIISSAGLVEKPFFAVFPNPASSFVNIKCKANQVQASLWLYNSVGAKVLEYTLTGNHEQIDVSTLPNGSYIGVLTGNEGNEKQRFKLIVAH